MNMAGFSFHAKAGSASLDPVDQFVKFMNGLVELVDIVADMANRFGGFKRAWIVGEAMDVRG